MDAAGFRFFTHHGSRKARALAENPRAALLFAWAPLQRQVEVRGTAERMGAATFLSVLPAPLEVTRKLADAGREAA